MCRSWGPHIYWGGGTTIRGVDWAAADYLVVDDVPWEYFSGKKQLLGGQHEFILTEKYIRKTRITFGKPVIYICNLNPFNNMDSEEYEYYNVNCVLVELGNNKLY